MHCCHCSGSGLCRGVALIPGPGTSTCHEGGFIPSPKQYVQVSGVAAAVALSCNCGSDLISGQGTPYAEGWPKILKRE